MRVALLLTFLVWPAMPAGKSEEHVPVKTLSGSQSYQLGPQDQLTIWASEIEELDGKKVVVDPNGNLHLPLAGKIHVAGMTVEALERQLEEKAAKYVRHPSVTVSVTEFRTYPVSVLGAVGNPGVHKVQGAKRLTEVLSLAGGPKPDSGHSLVVTRAVDQPPLAVPGVHNDEQGRYQVAEIPLNDLLEGKQPGLNIEILPEDVLTVPLAGMVYVVGEVDRAGGFTLKNDEELSVLKALSLAGGLRKAAVPSQARILRTLDGGKREERRINLHKILIGKQPDVGLRADDILFVPNSAVRRAGMKVMESAIQLTTGVIIFRR